ncbi:MAG: site-2 protease family protein [Patescibacteria group bacterium]
MLELLFSSPGVFVIYIFALLLAVTVHEFSHAKVADYLGDPTPRLQGRISFNPVRHLDPTGILFLLFFGFGWGKPVEFDPFNLKNPRKDAGLISIAGPISNFILASICAILMRLFLFFDQVTLVTIGNNILAPVIMLNIILGVFNLIPIHPLDGFKIVGALLSSERAREWYQLERFGLIFLLLLIIPIGGSNMLSTIIRPIVNVVLSFLIPSAGRL